MRLPRRAAIERSERFRPCFHVGKPAQPDEAVGIVQVAEGADDVHAFRFLALDELPFEQRDQLAAPSRL
jgi:hypothetical protein